MGDGLLHVFVQNNAQCSETIEKLIFRLLVFEIWLLNLCRYSLKTVFVRKDAQCSEMDFRVHELFFFRFLVFEIYSILYSIFVVNWGTFCEPNSETLTSDAR